MTLTDQGIAELALLLQKAKAQAWEEGYREAHEDWDEDTQEIADLRNPYKENQQ